MRRFLENEPNDDAFDGNTVYAPPTWSPMRIAGIVMFVTTILSYLILFWQAERRRRREENKAIVNKTLDEEGSFLAFAPYTADAQNSQFGHGTLFDGFNGDLALRNSAVEEQDNHHFRGDHKFSHGVFSRLSEVRQLWMNPLTTAPARRLDSVGGPKMTSSDKEHATDVREPNHNQTSNSCKVNYIDPTCDDGSCSCSPESCWTKFASLHQLEREREHPFDEASSGVYDPVYGSKYSLPTDEEEAQQSQEVFYSPKVYKTEEPLFMRRRTHDEE